MKEENQATPSFIREELIDTGLFQIKGETLGFVASGKEIIRINSDGRISWKGREITTDDDFRSAMADLAKKLQEI